MSIDHAEIARVAGLARLAVQENEADDLVASIRDILGFVETLDAARIDGVEPMAHPLDGRQRLRPDVVTESDHREAFQAIAPAVEAGLYLVPRVIE